MEGFGYPVVEAFKTGLPVVSSNIDIIREVSSGAAVLVDPEKLLLRSPMAGLWALSDCFPSIFFIKNC